MSHAKVFVIIMAWSMVVAMFVGMTYHTVLHKAYFGAMAMVVCLVALIAILSKILSEES